MYQIKLCPFCGGKPYLEDHSRSFINGQSTKAAYVRCTKCNARGPRFNISDYGNTSRSEEAVQDAVNAWNQRFALPKGEAGEISVWDNNEKREYRLRKKYGKDFREQTVSED